MRWLFVIWFFPSVAYMFDETYIHYAKNETDMSRIVLFCDIERPMYFRWAAALNRMFSNVVMRGEFAE